MVVHLEMDLTKVVEFDPKSSFRESPWANQWLNMVKRKLTKQMLAENDNQLQLTLKHLMAEAEEVKFD